MKKDVLTQNRGTMSLLNGLHNACSSSNAEAPALVREEGAPVVGIADSRIRRYYAVKESRRKNLETAGSTFFEQRVIQKFFDIANDIFELEVWRQYPELVGKAIAVYDDWSIGPETFEVETCDLFKPVGLKELVAVRSTRSDDVNIGAIRSATITN